MLLREGSMQNLALFTILRIYREKEKDDRERVREGKEQEEEEEGEGGGEVGARGEIQRCKET